MCRIELYYILLEALLHEQVIIQVTASHVFQEEIDPELILEHVIHTQHEGMLGLEEDFLLILGVLDLLFVNQDILIDPLHCIKLAVVLVDHQEYLTEGAFVNHFPDLKILQTILLLILAHVSPCDQQ